MLAPLPAVLPAVTIAFVKHHGSGEAEFASRFTYESSDFALVSNRREAEEMVAAAGFPAERAPIVEDFCRRSASLAAHSFWTGVVITVVRGDGTAGDPRRRRRRRRRQRGGGGSRRDQGGYDCAICYRPYVLGSAEDLQLYNYDDDYYQEQHEDDDYSDER